jgi:hypothetical protein
MDKARTNWPSYCPGALKGQLLSKVRTQTTAPSEGRRSSETRKREPSEASDFEPSLSGKWKGLDQAKLESALDDLIKTFEDVNTKLDELIAEAKK